MDDQMFRKAMGQFATGVTVITTSIGDKPFGMTANAFMSVSLSPKLVLVSIGEKAKMKGYIDESGLFAVNVLNEDQRDISMLFAGQLKKERDISFVWKDGLPLIPHSLVSLTCKVVQAHVAGDHTLYIGEVTGLEQKEGKPLLFVGGKYNQLS
ncbi:flavin reductase family protein [Bacillus sp. 1P06AnD]|uniref:flavin reductase family protein n=1 Tax=Bacillus sp. 1P06AnD TaxID=3132208 RepID=UPI0039A3E46F